LHLSHCLERAKGQGIGLHSQQEVEQLTLDDLKNHSIILGQKKFILEDGPCEDDCAVFGQLSQAVWGTPGPVYERALNGIHGTFMYTVCVPSTRVQAQKETLRMFLWPSLGIKDNPCFENFVE
jgi:hypothetical protein